MLTKLYLPLFASDYQETFGDKADKAYLTPPDYFIKFETPFKSELTELFRISFFSLRYSARSSRFS